MSHWAEIDDDNVVLRVVACNNNDPAGDEGYSWLIDNLGGRWIQTSFSASFRKNFAGAGFTYDEARDAFIPPQLYPSWTLDEDTCRWVPPIPRPTNGKPYLWDETAGAWVAI